jgi:hypothetical protein
MKKIKIYIVLALIISASSYAQYNGGIGNGDASINLSNAHLPVNEVGVEVPDSYKLFQNFPNPFNPSTMIKFQIKESGFTTLKVFDILGKEVAVLVNEKLKEGTYEIQFSVNQYTNINLSSGIYFYKLVTESFSDTKRMIILK